MDEALIAYDRAWNETPKDERNAVCQRLADEYMAAHPELAAQFAGFTIPELVTLVGIARANGDEERRILLDIVINAGFEYQQIGGVRNSAGGARRDNPAINVDGDRRQIGA